MFTIRPLRSCAHFLTLATALLGSPSASAQIVLLDSFDPPETGGLCGAGFDATRDLVWAYACFDANLYGYTTDGTLASVLPRAGAAANDVDIEVAPQELMLDSTLVPAGSPLFIDGESGVAEIYALEFGTGTVLATLVTDFGVSHVVGGAYHPMRDTFFLVQDRVPGPDDENRIAEIDPATGAVLNSFQITSTFSVNFGDIDVSNTTGNLFVVSSAEQGIAEYTPDGTFVQTHALPAGVSGLSGIGLDCAAGEAWVCSGGTLWRLGNVPCGLWTSYCAANPNSTGSVADLTASGTASSAAGDLTVEAGSVPNQNGIFFHAANMAQIPFGNGFLCATGSLVRGAVTSGSGNSASYTYDNSDNKHSLSAHVGSNRKFQYWFRDPMGGGALFNTSNAIAINVLP